MAIMLDYFRGMMKQALSITHPFTVGEILHITVGKVKAGGINVSYEVQPLRWCHCRSKCYMRSPGDPKDLGVVICNVYEQTPRGIVGGPRRVRRYEPYAVGADGLDTPEHQAGHLRPAETIEGRIYMNWFDMHKIMGIDYMKLQSMNDLYGLAAQMLFITDCAMLTDLLTELYPHVIGGAPPGDDTRTGNVVRRTPRSSGRELVHRLASSGTIGKHTQLLRDMFRRNLSVSQQ
jgi:hypothetical protein